jgi:hypothetical protein
MFANKKKLSLNKETIRALSGTEMQGLVGGAGYALNTAVFHCSDNCCTKTCSTCGCTKMDFGANFVLPAYRM